MDLATAQQAAGVAAQITTLSTQTQVLTDAIASNTSIVSGKLFLQGASEELFIPGMNAADASIIYNALLSVLQSRLITQTSALGAIKVP